MDNETIIHSTLDSGYDFFITNDFGEEFHFKISTFEVPSGWLSEAIEVVDKSPDKEGRVFHFLSDFDVDIEKAELSLKAKIKKGINQKHLRVENDRISISDGQILRGRISWGEQHTDTAFNNFFEIDGRRVTIEKFVEMLEAYGSFNFKFQIFDSCDEME